MPDGKQAYCKPCCLAYQRRYHNTVRPKNNAETSRRNKLLREYGITPEQYDEMLAQQGGVCAICELPCKTGKRLAVDHDHKSGRVRGLLCMNCNRGIGHFQDDARLTARATKYLT